MNNNVNVIMAFDIVEADEPRNVRIVSEVKRRAIEMGGRIKNSEVECGKLWGENGNDVGEGGIRDEVVVWKYIDLHHNSK
jgi:hypothetical protein